MQMELTMSSKTRSGQGELMLAESVAPAIEEALSWTIPIQQGRSSLPLSHASATSVKAFLSILEGSPLRSAPSPRVPAPVLPATASSEPLRVPPNSTERARAALEAAASLALSSHPQLGQWRLLASLGHLLWRWATWRPLQPLLRPLAAACCRRGGPPPGCQPGLVEAVPPPLAACPCPPGPHKD